ncbi:MAG: right-handed parallel beta-helix repeat-containing protein [Pseudomonadota bacterium]
MNAMPSFITFVLSVAILSFGSAAAETVTAAYGNADPAFERDLEACPNEGAGGVIGYLGQTRVCADILIGDLRETVGMLDGSVTQVVLLTSQPGAKTLYRVGEDRRPILAVADLARPHGKPLMIRGQRGDDGQHLVWFKGLDLIDTVCDPKRVIDAELCRDGQPSDLEFDGELEPWARRYEMTSLALVEEARMARLRLTKRPDHDRVTAGNPRAYCVVLRAVRGFTIEDLAFEDCWMTAILLVNAQRIEARRARLHGSTFGMLAVATDGLSPASHSFTVSDSHWIQSPGAYRPSGEPCENPHRDLRCALDVWDDIPWGVAHHHIWRPLNGALFASVNIAGNVLIENNLIERAYNGIRMISQLPGTGRNVEIRGNTFRFIRDNAVEPETKAENWVIKHNRFENVHAWISTDGVSGEGFYVFGNTATYDPERMPGSGCSDDVAWEDSPRLEAMAGDHGRYVLIDVAYDPTSVDCLGHFRGTILKTGDKRKSKFPYLDRISIFHNSWRTRSPIFSSKHASPLSHFNNLIEFTGCGTDGALHCKQVPVPDQYCQPGNKRTRGRVALQQYWTDDGGALVVDCATLTPGPAEPDERAAVTREVSHIFCRDLVNRSFSGLPYGAGSCGLEVTQGSVVSSERGVPTLDQAASGCRVQIGDGAASPDCNSFGGLIGAFDEFGRLYDFAIPDAGFLGGAFQP